ncbi:hypothetical protein UCREL1_4759 [Eutypa lata UCREL1]|uniref:Large ribosomal subunit protein mL50 n=1 Tax=Eutypa lata (strain UCR-EL1) TaxID=1287681 RepID=M7TE85_EUTLA|nr:hypothetical protein UCREL1_4759 [Eutypa lata UCREL1]
MPFRARNSVEAGKIQQAQPNSAQKNNATDIETPMPIPGNESSFPDFSSNDDDTVPSLSNEGPIQTPAQQQQQQQQQQEGVEEAAYAPTTSSPEEFPPETTPPALRLYTPPPPRSRAARPDEVPDAGYVPATTADGLRSVGGLDRWWDAPDHWRGDFVGFRPKRRTTDPALLEVAVRRAVVEALALRRAGREDELVGVWPLADGPEEVRRLLAAVELRVSRDGGAGEVQLGGDVDAVLESLRWRDESEVVQEALVEGEADVASASTTPRKKTGLSAAGAEKYREGWDKSWKNVPLDDSRIKFAVTKRIFQLTGQLVPDHKLPEISSVQTLLRVLQKPPKLRTLTDDLAQRRQELTDQLPNVAFAAKRLTRGDREKAVGRFKLIEDEFKKRDLPLGGHGFARKNKERSWLRGGV